MLQVISPTASGLFHKAIVQSGAYTFWSGLRSFEDSRTVGRNFATAAGCPDQSAACLRSLSVEAVLALEADSRHGPVVGRPCARAAHQGVLGDGKFNRVPIFNGNTHDEYVWFQAFAEINTGHVITPDEYPARLAASFGCQRRRGGASVSAQCLQQLCGPRLGCRNQRQSIHMPREKSRLGPHRSMFRPMAMSSTTRTHLACCLRYHSRF